jgi:hypothetical protein
MSWFLRDAPPGPVTMEDCRAVLRRLEPVARRSMSGEAEVYILIWPGRITVSVETKEGSKLQGRGTMLREAVENLMDQSARINEALK